MWYALADVFVHPALSEPWGVSVNEALACGVPAIVSSGVGAHVDLIEPGVTGEVFPVSDHQALADILLAYSGKSREELDAVSRACQSRMADWNYETTEKVFLDMLGTLQ
jgi:glycosyltransferase involved in cell wall biosynthesis